MSSPADRNLLYGLLAFQLGFIDRQTLVTSLNTWVASKARGLGDILAEQGVLPDGVNDLLDALVEEHLRMHDGSPEKSLAALSSVGSIRDDLEILGDTDLNATLGHLPADTTQPGQIGSLRVTTVGPQTDGRFRILKMHAKGGLGQVSLAFDEELSREVALKELQNKFADDEQIRIRFAMEAEITGGLEHPGIVPVYGAGHYADGRPFYAMRFVRGDSLQDAVQAFHERRMRRTLGTDYELELRKLLQRFIDVCDAIEYAHSRGVLHRDLKPGNIMLGRYGETLVVDWGLAKPLGRREPKAPAAPVPEKTLLPTGAKDSAPTQMGSAVGTPHYMSPEQAAGRLGELGPSSDVYSLGATLYCLLTGQPPFQGKDVAEILAAVQFAKVKPPRQLNPQVAKPLEAACLKAMARDPDQRYSSPRALSQDIELWLADQRVTAYREPLHVRTSRWLRKHRMVAGAVFSAFAVALVSALVIAGVLADSNQKLADKEAAAVAARDDAIVARNEATALAGKNQELALEAQRQVAETFRRQAIRLLNNGDIASGLSWLVKSLESLPAGDVASRDFAVRNLAAWCRDMMVLKKMTPAGPLDLGTLPGTDRVVGSHYKSADENISEESGDPWVYGSVTFQLLDAESLMPVSPKFGPSYLDPDYTIDEENDIFCAVVYVNYETLDPSKIETFPEELEITDENRDQLVASVAQIELQRCSLSQGKPVGKPLMLKQRSFRFEQDPENTFYSDESDAPPEPIGDELVGIDIVSGFAVIRNCTTHESEVWSMNTGERVDVEIPLGESRLSDQGLFAVRSKEQKIRFLDLPLGLEAAWPLEHEQPVTDFEFSATGDRMVTVTNDGKVHGWMLSGKHRRKKYVSEELIAGPLHSLEMVGEYILTTSKEGVVQLWRMDMYGRAILMLRSSQEIPKHEIPYNTPAYFAGDSGRQVVIETNDTLKLWNSVREPDKDKSFYSSNKPVIFSLDKKNSQQGMLWHVDGKYCVTYANDELSLWDMYQSKRVLLEHPGKVEELSLSTELRRLTTIGDDGVIRIWDLNGNQLVQSANAQPGRRRTQANFFGKKGDRLTTFEQRYDGDEFSGEEIAQMWDVPARVIQKPPSHVVFGEEGQSSVPIPPAVYMEKTPQAVSDTAAWRANLGGADNLVLSSDGQTVFTCKEALSVSENGSTLVKFVPAKAVWVQGTEQASTPGRIEVVDWLAEEPLRTTIGSFEYAGRLSASRIRVSPDGKSVAVVRKPYSEHDNPELLLVQLWSIAKNSPLGPVIKIESPTPPNWKYGDGTQWRQNQLVLAFDDSVQKFVAGVSRRDSAGTSDPDQRSVEFRIWDLSTGKPIGKPLSHDDEVLCAAFSPNGEILATGSSDGTIKLWDSNSGELLSKPLQDVSNVRELFFSPDGDRLLTMTSGKTWSTWQIPTGKALMPPVPLPHEGWIVAAVSRDGDTLFTGGADGRLQQWDISSGMAIGPPHRFGGAVTAIKAGLGLLVVQADHKWQVIRFDNIGSEAEERAKLWAESITAARLDETDRIWSMTAEELSHANERLEQLGGPVNEEFRLPQVFHIR